MVTWLTIFTSLFFVLSKRTTPDFLVFFRLSSIMFLSQGGPYTSCTLFVRWPLIVTHTGFFGDTDDVQRGNGGGGGEGKKARLHINPNTYIMDTYLGVPNAVESKNEESLRWTDLISLQVLKYIFWTQHFFPFLGREKWRAFWKKTIEEK